MLDILPKLISFLTDVIMPLVVGFMLYKFTSIKTKQLDKLLILNIVLIYPITVIITFWNFSFDASMIWLPLIGLIMPIITGVLGYLVVHKRYSDPLQQGSYIVSSMLSNRGTIGGLTLFILIGEIGYAYNQLILILAPINIYLIAFPVAQYYHAKSENTNSKLNFSFKKVIINRNNLPALGILIGFLLSFSGIPRPEPLTPILSRLIKVVAWCFLVPIGASIRFNRIKQHIKHIMSLSILKFIIAPIITYILAIFLFKDPLARFAVIITSMMPCAINAIVCCKLNDLDVDIAISAFLFTTILYFIIIFPLICFVSLQFVL